MSDITTRLWERAEAAISRGILVGDAPNPRYLAKVATVAVLRELSTELADAEDDEAEWPDSDDLEFLADELEAKP